MAFQLPAKLGHNVPLGEGDLPSRGSRGCTRSRRCRLGCRAQCCCPCMVSILPDPASPTPCLRRRVGLDRGTSVPSVPSWLLCMAWRALAPVGSDAPAGPAWQEPEPRPPFSIWLYPWAGTVLRVGTAPPLPGCCGCPGILVRNFARNIPEEWNPGNHRQHKYHYRGGGGVGSGGGGAGRLVQTSQHLFFTGPPALINKPCFSFLLKQLSGSLG